MSDEWQPIDSAPKDGSEFLGFGSYLYPGDSKRTVYMSITQWSGVPGWPWETDEGQHVLEFFSHWMPLPPPPVEGA